MNILKELYNKIFNNKKLEEEPWLAYYSEKERKIEFTDKNIYEYLEDSTKNYRDLYALNYFGNRMTFKELIEKVEYASRALRSLGVKEKDVVTICMPNTPEAVIAFYAINKIGAIADMVHPLSSEEQIKFYLNESKSRVMIMIDINYDKLKNVMQETLVYKTIIVSAKDSMPTMTKIGYQITRGFKVKKPKFRDSDYMTWKDFMIKGLTYNKPYQSNMQSKDIAVILHSGGTTGSPKGITLSNFNFNAEAQQGGVVVMNVRPKDKIVTILPIFHGFGLCVSIHCPLCLKMEAILIPEFDGKRFHKIMKNYRPNVVAGVPTLWEAMLSNKRFDEIDLSPLKYVISGGDYLTISMEEKMNNFLHKHGANISISKGYGMTESVAASAYTFEGTNEPGSIGIPLPGNSFKICNIETHEELPFGEEGEICVHAPTIMVGYLNNKEETEKVIKKHKDGKYWLHTGDIGYITPEGIIYYTQRLKRMIVSSGFNVYPNAIEETIEKHPEVQKCCVVGIPHPYKMQVPKAFIVLKDNQKPTSTIKKDIKELCEKNLEKFSLPKEYEFRDSLPQTLLKKTDFKQLEKEELEKYNSKNKNK